MHCRRVRPAADDRLEGRPRTEPPQRACERRRLVARVDDPIEPAPPELQGNARARDRARECEWTTARVRAGTVARGSTDLLSGLDAQAATERGAAPLPLAALVAREPLEVPVAPRHVCHGVEGCDPGEKGGMPGQEQQALLPAHARAERVDLRGV